MRRAVLVVTAVALLSTVSAALPAIAMPLVVSPAVSSADSGLLTDVRYHGHYYGGNNYRYYPRRSYRYRYGYGYGHRHYYGYPRYYGYRYPHYYGYGYNRGACLWLSGVLICF